MDQSAPKRGDATSVLLPSGADQATALANLDRAIKGLTISDPPTQAEVHALRDKTEELANDVRALATLVHALRGVLVGGWGPSELRCGGRTASRQV